MGNRFRVHPPPRGLPAPCDVHGCALRHIRREAQPMALRRVGAVPFRYGRRRTLHRALCDGRNQLLHRFGVAASNSHPGHNGRGCPPVERQDRFNSRATRIRSSSQAFSNRSPTSTSPAGAPARRMRQSISFCAAALTRRRKLTAYSPIAWTTRRTSPDWPRRCFLPLISSISLRCRQAVWRGRCVAALTAVEATGTPLDMPLVKRLLTHGQAIEDGLVDTLGAAYPGVFREDRRASIRKPFPGTW